MLKNMLNDKKSLELFILSALSLFIELLIIRWMSSDIRAFTIFRTFPLISCFVGLGLGMALNNDKSYKHFGIACFAFCAILKAMDFLGLSSLAFPSFAVFQWANLAGLVTINTAYVILILLLIIILLALPFAICLTLGSRIGIIFNEISNARSDHSSDSVKANSSLKAYSLNLLGAIFGSLFFQYLVFLGLPPYIMLLLVLLIIFLYQIKDPFSFIKNIIILTLLPLIFTLIPNHQALPLIKDLIDYKTKESSTFWSPYQRIDLSVLRSQTPFGSQTALSSNAVPNPKAALNSKSTLSPQSNNNNSPAQLHHNDTEFNSGSNTLVGLELSVNHTFYQYFLNTNPDSPIFDTILINSIRKDYNLPFLFNKAESALIVGAGTGQNVSFALANNVRKIDAVEIDPCIIKIGKTYNTDYSSNKVNLICDDARHFFSQCKEKYDVIDFSTLDSHTVAGFGSSVRLDAYVYTKESIAKAASLLSDDGVLVVTFATVAPWTQARLYETFKQAVGYEPLLLEGYFSSSIFVIGPKVKDHTIIIPNDFKQIKPENFKKSSNSSQQRILSDDWPYLYVQTNIIDYPYLLVVLEILCISIFATRKFLFAPNNPLYWQMFFLGSAFMLLELHAISFLSLLYGSTWLTSAIVINSVLITIFLANLLVLNAEKFKQLNKIININATYLLLASTILINYFIPSNYLLNQFPNPYTYAFLTISTVLPMGVAAIIFSLSFAKAELASKALAFNLFGAVIGGLLEYLSNYLGIRNLLLIALTLYLISFLCFKICIKNNSKSTTILSN